jgi:3-hydroxyisobutyrate dehydrogenase
MGAKRIAFLGLGAMGRRMATRLVEAGHDVVVWSRSGVPAEAPALHERGVKSPRAAADGADVVIAMVTDDEASRAVWEDPEHGALLGLRTGAIAIESSTLTPAWVRTLAEHVRAAGAEWLDAPVMGSRPQAEAGALVHLVGGEAAAVERARPVLEAIGSAVLHVGPTPAGAMTKLIANALFGVQVAVLAELLGLASKAGLDGATMVEALGRLPVTSPAAKAAAMGMLADRFEPMFPTSLVAKDLRYTVETAKAADAPLPVVDGVKALFEDAIARELGGENLTAVAKLYR